LLDNILFLSLRGEKIVNRKKINITEKLNSIDNLPTLPTIASQLLDLLGDNNSSMMSIARIISADPSLTSKVLRIANSAYYGMRKKIDTIKLSLVILGIEEVTNIILSISLFKTFQSDTSSSSLDLEKFWEHSLATAHISRLLCRILRIRMHGEEFTAGLIHDIGKIIFEQYFFDDYCEINDKIIKEKLINYKVEEDILGVNHMDVGAWLAEKWKLPSNLVESIRFHHFPKLAEESPILSAVVSLADKFVKQNEIGQSINFEEINLENAEAWQIIKEYSPRYLELDIEKTIESINKEIEKIPSFLSVIK